MNYSLAKQLKDSGFPQGNALKKAYLIPDGKESSMDSVGAYLSGEESIGVYEPTLEELIEACEQLTFTFGLEKHTNDWRAGTLETGGVKEMSVGSTPTEAVARLWLALNATSSKDTLK